MQYHSCQVTGPADTAFPRSQLLYSVSGQTLKTTTAYLLFQRDNKLKKHRTVLLDLVFFKELKALDLVADYNEVKTCTVYSQKSC